MNALWNAFDNLDRVFLLCAIAGGLLFIARSVMSLLGAGHHDVTADGHGFDLGSHDLGAGHDAAGDGHAHDSGDATDSFRLLTFQGVIAFILMFGLFGLAIHRGSHLGALPAIGGGLIAGGVMMLLIAKLTQMMYGLQSAGNLDVRQAVGQQGTIYLGIPAAGAGQVQVSVQRRLRVMDAIAQDRAPIKTGERVRVVDIADGGTLVVQRVETGAPHSS